MIEIKLNIMKRINLYYSAFIAILLTTVFFVSSCKKEDDKVLYGKVILKFEHKIDSNAVENSGVYELCLANREIEYKNDKTGVFYIGSAKNLRKRLKEHLRAKGRNGKIRKIL